MIRPTGGKESCRREGEVEDVGRHDLMIDTPFQGTTRKPGNLVSKRKGKQ